jgi:hydroxyethylthiazole kinase-like sugar kinase family protein
LLPRKNHSETSTDVFAIFMEVLLSTEAPMVAGQKKVIASERGKQKLRDILHLGCPTTALVSNCCSKVMP